MRFPARLAAITAATAAAVTAFAAPAFAGSPHFVGTPTFTTSGATVTVQAKEAGLGDEAQIVATLTGTAFCINGGGNDPKAANKTSVTALQVIPVQNGKASYTITATAVFDPGSPCPDPMDVTYTDPATGQSTLLLTDKTNNLTAVPVPAP
jgi:hypothetical protein